MHKGAALHRRSHDAIDHPPAQPRRHRVPNPLADIVEIHAGVYPALALDPVLDSGTAMAPLTLAGAAAEPPPTLSAGVAVFRAAWRPATDDSTMAAAGVLVADLAAMGFGRADFGRLPDDGDGIDGCDQLKLQKMQARVPRAMLGEPHDRKLSGG